ncbi:MAG: hypothetical protein HEP71_27410 [Roseivirga sp.]|nr:hypothetical protein [Roseivirga sp.]
MIRRVKMIVLLLFLTTCYAWAQTELSFKSDNKELNKAFKWARNKALSYAHDGSDLVGHWYEAALPNREAFCMRDVSHQSIGAEILGLSQHNFNMFLKFAQNISADKDYCSYWEINRYDKPAPVDYENDKDFWYNLPANFDMLYSAHRLYTWSGNKAYLDNPDFLNFYQLTMNQYINHWDLSFGEITHRKRSMHQIKDNAKSRFGGNRGIPTYNEGGRGEAYLGIDMSASIVAAYKAYAEILGLSGRIDESKKYLKKATREQKFLDDFWWDNERQAYRSIQYSDRNFDYFMVGDNQAFLHYLLYFDAISDPKKIKDITELYVTHFDKLIVELKSYLPIIFYENGHSDIATKMILDLCSAKNPRRDYPENSFTVIEHITRGLMGINVSAPENMVSTFSRLEKEQNRVEMENVSLLSNKISVIHLGSHKTVFTNQSGPALFWHARMAGQHEYLFVNGEQKPGSQIQENDQWYTYQSIKVSPGEVVSVSTEK